MANGIILMTALIPTKGHQFLIDFAANYVRAHSSLSELFVIVCTRSQEPIAGYVRVAALRDHYGCDPKDPTLDHGIVHIIHHKGNDDPQNPQDDPDFWGFWRDTIRKYVPSREGDVVFSSEMYGLDLAKALDAEFVPCDIARSVLPYKSTDVRIHLNRNFYQILDEFQPYMMTRITTFGAESTGKTTMARALSNDHNAHYVPEWAREYLETVGPEITDHKMDVITHAQYAIQKSVSDLRGKQMIVQDTDLLSTIGYYRLYRGSVPSGLISLFNETKSDLYILMNSKIPFEKNILRYGGDRRESDDEFWAMLLTEFDCEYYEVKQRDHTNQTMEIAAAIDRFTMERYGKLWEFKRT